MGCVGGAVTGGQEIDAGGIGGGACGGGEIEGGKIVWSGVVVFRMQHESIEGFIAAAIIEQDETDDDIGVGKRFDLAIEAFQVAEIGFGKGRVGKIEELGEVNVESGVLDAERKGVIDHLDLETFFGRRRGEGSSVLMNPRWQTRFGGDQVIALGEAKEQGEKEETGGSCDHAVGRGFKIPGKARKREKHQPRL
jgi:hypothetical protein